MDNQRIEAAIKELLAAIGEDLARPGITATPRLVAEAAEEIYGGTGRDPAAEIEPIAGPDSLVLMQDIGFHAMCEHHLLPFFGHVHLAFMPRGGRIAGFGSLARAVDVAAHRLTIQERLVQEVADAVVRALDPEGVAVAAVAQQMCMQMRGGRHVGTSTITFAARGSFASEPQAGEIRKILLREASRD